ncbi:putative NADP-dependent mannitol dehydrogenase [Microstroma glucosiphilum]|uniref:Putative NADP-dependent mannitol dehydrogenase n=1 Tax=Pseudomicrostroma glucosiphilum TaxID=1684307 RepID=A0A316U516_9BASI|nr:putative NADP-dependent mannitol dehydrogenase [Pseudomicrostroma glucosiphilum]PWN19924.1 putative NADP-dependent mannitol dehydrogenase [Pseudomicrostroma glucosiphilum]
MSMTIEECSATRQPRPIPETSRNVLEQLSMKGKVTLVTGAADGIGLAAVEAVIEAGGDAAMVYRSNDTAVEKAKKLAEQYGVKVRAYKCDVTSADEVQKVIKDVFGDFGRIDVLVANAGMAVSQPLLEQSLEDYKKQMSVNVDGVVYCAKFVGEIFKKQGFGNLIITSSMSAHIVNVPVDQPIYNLTKAAVTHFGKSLAREWREFARVNIVSPGFFYTKMGASPQCENEAVRKAVLARQGDTKELKGIFLYLASDASTFTTGSDILVDGGYTLT